jgi:hypothetical protein
MKALILAAVCAFPTASMTSSARATPHLHDFLVQVGLTHSLQQVHPSFLLANMLASNKAPVVCAAACWHEVLLSYLPATERRSPLLGHN